MFSNQLFNINQNYRFLRRFCPLLCWAGLFLHALLLLLENKNTKQKLLKNRLRLFLSFINWLLHRDLVHNQWFLRLGAHMADSVMPRRNKYWPENMLGSLNHNQNEFCTLCFPPLYLHSDLLTDSNGSSLPWRLLVRQMPVGLCRVDCIDVDRRWIHA